MSKLSKVVENVAWNGQTIAYIVSAGTVADQTTFVTASDANLQLGFVAYESGGEVARHVHKPLERHVVGTAEALIVQRGRCALDLYNDERERIATREVRTGDVILLLSGGHGFRMLEDTVLLEIKQGPYTGLDEKVRF